MQVWGALLWVLTATAVAALAWKGRTPERAVAAGVCLVTAAGMVLYPLEVGNTRWAVALCTAAFSVGVIGMAFRADRWWLLAAAGVLVVNGGTYLAGWLLPDWSAYVLVGARRCTWVMLMMLCLVGAWEARLYSAWLADGRVVR